MTLKATFTDEVMTLNGALGEVQTIQTVKPISITSEMTQPVGVDDDGKLYTLASTQGLNGKDGFSPSLYASPYPGGHRVYITNATGTDFFYVSNGVDGAPGKDGVSLSHSWNGSILTVTSAAGTSSANLQGAPGKDGYSPQITMKSTTEGVRLEITDQEGVTRSALITHGRDGSDGANGYSPVVTMESIDEGVLLSITDRTGETGTIIYNGTNGIDGINGKSAYEYAKEGGYTGSEVEFAAKLAAEHPVTSVNGKTGAVTIQRSDLKLVAENWTFELENGTNLVKSVILSSDNASN
ncbi:MAG: hypothetical protein J6R82_04980 [Clostridia bacterium]|nr:hypothetical protein [Clostridia bacterium]